MCYSLIRVLRWATLFIFAVVPLTPTQSTPVHFHAATGQRILVDASKDGGGWWYPQGGVFDPNQGHQGKPLADYMRGIGYQVDELGQGVTIADTLLSQYDNVITVASSFPYDSNELRAYEHFLSRPTHLFLLLDYMWPGQKDQLADLLGIPLAGKAAGMISRFAPGPITQGELPFFYLVGSAVADTSTNPAIQYLGWLSEDNFVDLNLNEQQDPGEPSGPPVMGMLNYQQAKVFFIGDENCMEQVPQPLLDNLMRWSHCEGLTGNVDCSSDDRTDISDLTAFVDNLYISTTPFPCPQEANVDGSADGNIDVSDLSALIDYLYMTFKPLARCQPADSIGQLNPVSWNTGVVSLTADDFYIDASGVKYLANVPGVSVGGSSSTLELTWIEHGSDMRLYIYFAKDATNWWSYAIRTYDGAMNDGTRWIYYSGEFFKSALGTQFQGDVDLTSGGSDNGVAGKLHFKNLRLSAF
jgi:hypothetical protein